MSEKPLTLKDILTETSERGFSLVIGLLALPFLLPMPPGLAGPLGFGCLILAIQMAVGRRSPWLPKRVGQFRFPKWLVLNLREFDGLKDSRRQRRKVFGLQIQGGQFGLIGVSNQARREIDQ
ncbi:MAG: exopolysaccharide biosynthesis protein, partial [Kovacikia sp.]